MSFHRLRIAYYPPQDKIEPLEGQLRYGAHTDLSGFTILWQEDAPGGLEVMDKDGTWVPVNPVSGSLVINSGDIIQRWTNDKWKSNLHRVVNPAKPHSDRHRLSFVFFTGPNLDSVIEPLPVCCDSNNPPKYPSIRHRDHWRNRVKSGFSKEDENNS